MSFPYSVAAEMSPPFVVGLLTFPAAREGVNLLLQSTPACLLLSSVFSPDLLLWGIPSPEPSAVAAHTVAGEGGKEYLGKVFSLAGRLQGGRMHLSCEPFAALSWVWEAGRVLQT